MQAIIGADIHGSSKTPRKLSTFKKLIRQFTKLAIVYGTGKVIGLGDFFDKRWGTPVEVVLAFKEELEYAQSRGVTWVLLPGNHDIASKHDMGNTFLRVFDKLAYVVEEPEIIHLDNGGAIFLCPWRPSSELRQDLRAMAKEAVKLKSGPKVLMTHTPLREGMISRSNFQNKGLDISVADLMADAYDMVLMGDYHKKQQLAHNVWFLGSALTHTYGDVEPGGAYLLDLRAPVPHLKPVEFSEPLPQYRVWDMTHYRLEKELFLPTYDPNDYNLIKVPTHLEEAAEQLWPTAKVQAVVTREEERKLGRLKDTDPSNPSAVTLAFCKLRRWDDHHFKIGMEFIREAEEKL